MQKYITLIIIWLLGFLYYHKHYTASPSIDNAKINNWHLYDAYTTIDFKNTLNYMLNHIGFYNEYKLNDFDIEVLKSSPYRWWIQIQKKYKKWWWRPIIKVKVYYRGETEKMHELWHLMAFLMKDKKNYHKLWLNSLNISKFSPFYKYMQFWKKEGFVSDYAKTNIDESFAEDFTFYTIYNDYFMRRNDLKYRQQFFNKYFKDCVLSKNYNDNIKNFNKIYKSSNYLK